MVRLLRSFKHLNRLPEVRCARAATRQWFRLTCSYIGVPTRLPYWIELESGPFEFREISDIATFWMIHFRDVYQVTPEDRLIVDAGANIGAFTLYALLRAPRCHVKAIEPAPDSFERLRRMLKSHGLEHRCTLYQAAVGSRAGRTTIRLSPGSQFRVSGQGGLEVPMVTLDSVVESGQTVDLLKIDTEGAEYDALPAVSSTLLRRTRRIELEYHPTGQPEVLFQWLSDAGFVMETRDDHGNGYGTARLSRKARNAASA